MWSTFSKYNSVAKNKHQNSPYLWGKNLRNTHIYIKIGRFVFVYALVSLLNLYNIEFTKHQNILFHQVKHFSEYKIQFLNLQN